MELGWRIYSESSGHVLSFKIFFRTQSAADVKKSDRQSNKERTQAQASTVVHRFP